MNFVNLDVSVEKIADSNLVSFIAFPTNSSLLVDVIVLVLFNRTSPKSFQVCPQLLLVKGSVNSIVNSFCSFEVSPFLCDANTANGLDASVFPSAADSQSIPRS